LEFLKGGQPWQHGDGNLGSKKWTLSTTDLGKEVVQLFTRKRGNAGSAGGQKLFSRVQGGGYGKDPLIEDG